jgi:hypothetical protein
MRTSAVRVVPAPPLEPPFDDQRAPDLRPLPPDAGAQLTLQWRAADPARVAAASVAPRIDVPPSATVGASPAAWHAALRFLDRCQEILNGYRPASHIRPMSTPTDAQTIVEQVAAVARRTTQVPRAARRGARPGAVARRRVHVCEPRPGAAEAVAVLSQASRSWAVAFRLERRGAAWLCTTFTDVA